MVEEVLEGVELTAWGTMIEVIRLVDPKDPFWPRRIIREWLDERCYRDLVATDEMGIIWCCMEGPDDV
jgi:hypothetical protein